MVPNTLYYRKTIIAIHIAVWLIVILSPLTFFDRGDKFEIDKLIPMTSTPLLMMAVFYTMYLYITPKYLFGDDKRRFWIYTIIIVLAAGIALHLWITFSHNIFLNQILHTVSDMVTVFPGHGLNPRWRYGFCYAIFLAW